MFGRGQAVWRCRGLRLHNYAERRAASGLPIQTNPVRKLVRVRLIPMDAPLIDLNLTDH
jgi:hypothetical protein